MASHYEKFLSVKKEKLRKVFGKKKAKAIIELLELMVNEEKDNRIQQVLNSNRSGWGGGD